MKKNAETSLMLSLFVLLMCYATSSFAQFKEGDKKNGKISFYSNKLQGRRTASGEKYDMYAMTAAHPKLPFNSIVKVTNKKNGNWVTVRINDRGPYTHRRILDVSRAAALKLDMVKAGSASVEMEVLRVGGNKENPENESLASLDSIKMGKKESPKVKEESTTATAKVEKVKTEKSVPFQIGGTYQPSGKAAKVKGFGVQIGMSGSLEKALATAKGAQAAGFKDVYIQALNANGQASYRVLCGKEKDADKARALLPKVAEKGFAGAFVKAY